MDLEETLTDAATATATTAPLSTMESEETVTTAPATATDTTAPISTMELEETVTSAATATATTTARPRSFLRRTLTYIGGASVPAPAKPGREIHYHILKKSNESNHEDGTRKRHIVTKVRNDFQCHFCGFEAVWDHGLVLHCSTVHGVDFRVTFADTPNGVLNLAFKPLEEGQQQEILDYRLRFPHIRVLYWRHESVPEEVIADHTPSRQYYQFGSLQKMTIGEWMLDVDHYSGVDDQEWTRRLDLSFLDEFGDVSIEEKRFFVMWNDFIKRDTKIPRSILPQLCLHFVQVSAATIQKSGLEEQIIWHLTNLWDEGLISQSDLLACMTEYHEIVMQTSKLPALQDITTLPDN